MWIDHTMIPIGDADPYTDADGVQHLGQRDKSTIPGLMLVAETPRPDETPTGYTVDGGARGGVVVVLGDDGREYRIEMLDGVPVQVWHTAPRPEMSEAEALAVTVRDRKIDAQTALTASDITILRCTEAGIAVPPDWMTYRNALRAIVVNPTMADAIPPRPDYPAGT